MYQTLDAGCIMPAFNGRGSTLLMYCKLLHHAGIQRMRFDDSMPRELVDPGLHMVVEAVVDERDPGVRRGLP